MRSGRSREWLDGHARRLLAPVGADARDALAEDPADAVRDLFGVPVKVSERALDSDCGIDGLYFDRPPRIEVAASVSRRREHFTVCHEFGHHLQRGDDELMGLYESLGAAGEAVEEDVADTVAAELLMPSDRVREVIGAAGPCARDVASLYTETQASREACCVRAAQALRGPGYVVLADTDGTVRFAAVSKTVYRVGRGAAQPDGHLLARAGRTGSARGTDRLAYASGTLSDWMHGDAVGEGGYVFGVFTSGTPPWGGLSVLPSEGPRGADVSCPHCEQDFEAFGRPCASCGEHRCPTCAHCGCDDSATAPDRLCTECYLTKPSSQFRGEATVCADCA